MENDATKFITADFNLPSYMMFPRFLLDSDLSETTMLLYTLLLDRTKLSIKNEGWTDDKGYIFIYFTIEDLAKLLHRGETTIKNCLSALAEKGLIFRKRQGAGKPNRLYVKMPINCLSPAETSRKPTDKRSENCPNDSRKNDFQTVKKLPNSNNKYNNSNLTKRSSNESSTAYGCYENVFLTALKYSDLAATIPNLGKYIDKLSCYMVSKGKSYVNHAATIREWWIRDNPEKRLRSYEHEEGESL